MENDAKLAMLATVQPSPPLGVTGIIKEASKIPYRNGQLTLSILLLLLLPFSILALGFNLAYDSISTDLASKTALLPEDHSTPEAQEILKEMLEDTRRLVGVQAIFAVGFGVISLFSLVFTVHSSAVSLVGKTLTIGDLFDRFKVVYKKPLLTGFFTSLLSVACLVAAVLLVGFTALMITNSVLLVALVATEVIGAIGFYLYLANVWILGIVASVVEDGCYGMEAISKARKLLNGRKAQGIALMVLVWITGSILSGVLILSVRTMNHGSFGRSAVRTITMCLSLLAKLFFYVVYTVFYSECKKSEGQEVEVGEAREYAVLATDEV